jgi:hypothetical protein
MRLPIGLGGIGTVLATALLVHIATYTYQLSLYYIIRSFHCGIDDTYRGSCEDGGSPIDRDALYNIMNIIQTVGGTAYYSFKQTLH